MIDQTRNLDNLSSNFDDIGNKQKYMKEQLTDFNKIEKFKINFTYCHIAISKNGGLIAICKKKGFLDMSKGAILNKYVIVMYQDAYLRYYIPINWKYNERWIVCLDFTSKDNLYGILCDGGIFKFNYFERKYKEKVTSNVLKLEGVVKAKFFEKGFIAYTQIHNFYIIKDFKNPIAIFLCCFLDYITFSDNIDFLPIPAENSSSNKIELLLARQDDDNGGVIQVIQNEGENLHFYPLNTQWYEIGGANLILREKPRKLYAKKKENKEEEKKDEKDKKDKKDKKKEEENIEPPKIEEIGVQREIGKINALAISPSGEKIAFYNQEERTAFLMSSNFSGKYTEIKFDYDKNEYSKIENREIEGLLNYEEGCQFLFCGEDTLALSRQRFIILSKANLKKSLVYLIFDGGESEVKYGNLFSKCISETDGIRFLTNEGVFLISKVPNELIDICNPFSKSPSKKLIQIYKNTLLRKYNSEKDIRSLSSVLEDSIADLQIASANIFWTDNNNVDNKKELQFFVLKAAQYAKKFANKEEFNYDKFIEICKEMRIINNLRNDQNSPIFITFKEFKNINIKDLISRLIKYKNFKLAADISKFLDYGIKKVIYKYVIAVMKKQIGIIEETLDQPIKVKGKEIEDEKKKNTQEKYHILFNHLEKIPGISYIKLAKKAAKYGGEKLAIYLLEQEKSALIKIPQLLQMNNEKYDEPIEIAFATYDFNAVIKVLHTIIKEKKINILANPSLQKHFPKILLYLKKYYREEYNERTKIKLIFHEDIKNNKDKKDKKDKKNKNENNNNNIIIINEDNKNNLNYIKYFLELTKNNVELFYMKLKKYYQTQTLEERDQLIKECKTEYKKIDKDSDFDNKFIKKYLEKCENSAKFKFDCYREKGIIHSEEIELYNVSVYDCYKNGYMKGHGNWIESENSKYFDYSHKKLNLLKFRSYLEMKRPDAIDNQLAKTSLKKMGLTPLHLGEMYYDYNYYDKATEYLMQVKEPEYFSYVVDILKSMQKYKEALEVIISSKGNSAKQIMVNEILKKQPTLQRYVDEFCAKYKVNLQ